MPLNTRHRKVKGSWAEIAFLLIAERLGFIVSRPWDDCVPYDFAVETPTHHFYRVQVKSIWSAHGRRYTLNTHGSNFVRSSARDVDFLAGFIVPAELQTAPVPSIGWQNKITDAEYLRRPPSKRHRRPLILPLPLNTGAWYIIPIRRLRGLRGVHVYPHQPLSAGRFEKFRDAWNLFR